MKRLFLSLIVIFATIAIAASIVPTKFFVWVKGVCTEYSIDGKDWTYNNGTINIAGTSYNLADIDSIVFEHIETIDTMYITYNGTSAEVTPEVPGVTVNISNADVTITNENIDREMVYILSGASDCGSFVYNGDYKTTIRLNGLSLTGSSEEAIHIKDGKRIALEIADGTTNTLADASTDGGQKAAFYTKGHLEVSGAGTLNLVGNIKHGLASKEYMLIKKTAGTINITQAANDGIHCGQYFQMNGGSVTIKGVKGDGIQAEMAEDASEDDGKIIIKGGSLNVTTTANDCAALKSDSTLHIKDGSLTLNCSGNGSKAMKSKQDIQIDGGTMDITQSGGLYEETEEDETANEDTKSYRVYVSLPSSGGGGGFGGGGSSNAWTSVYLYKSDGTLVQKLTSTVSLSSGYSSTTFYYYDFKASDSETYYFKSDDYTSRNSGTTYTIKSANFSGPTNGSDYYYTISSNYSTSGSTRTYTLSNVTSTYANATATSTGADMSSSHGIKADAGVAINGGSIVMTLSGTATNGVSSDSDITVTGGNITITNTAKGQANGSDSYTAKGFSADGNMAIEGGTVKVTMSGSGGKGFKSDGTLTIGKSDGSGPTLTVSTSGSALSTSSSGNTGGFGGPGGGMSENTGSDAKAIKAQGAVYIYGGTMEVSTSTDGAEGLESKTAIYVNGGKNYFKCYDDCINSSGCIYFNGGVTVCYGYGNDAVDSNAGKTGAITIGNGTVFAYTTKGSPEEGLDCDNNSYIQITGTGIAISAGGAQGGGSSSSSISNAKQGYSFVTSTISYATNRYYTLADASGNNLVTYSFEASCSSNLALFTATGMKSGTSYNVKYSTTAPTDATTAWHGLYLGSSAAGTTSVTTFTAK